MFDAGFWEFVLIAVIALIVVGPERMPALAQSAGKYIGKLKKFIAQTKDDIDSELDLKNISQLGEIKDSGKILDIVDEVKNDISGDVAEIKKSLKNSD